MTKGRVVVTGATGFLGRRVCERLGAAGWRVVALSRGRPVDTAATEAIAADLRSPADYEEALRGAEWVVHLAALTGKDRGEQFQQHNVEGTRALVTACRQRGVRAILFVSSIAAAFPDRRWYPYAESKREAEAIVRASGIPAVIVRPTMIFGDGSKVEEGLTKLAMLPIVPLFDSGRVLVQPVHVDDVSATIVDLLQRQPDGCDVIDIGGPEVLSMRELLGRLRQGRGASTPYRGLPLPARPIRAVLGIMEPALLPVLPLTAGQMATFINNSVATPDHRVTATRHPLPPNPAERRDDQSGIPDRAGVAPGGVDEAAIVAECQRLTRYLIGMDATPYQVGKYVDAYRVLGLAPRGPFDRRLTRLADGSSIGLALADAYSGLLFRSAHVRARLVLALAVLESSTPSYRVVDAPLGSRWPWLAAGFVAVRAAVVLGVAVLLLAPLHIALRGDD